MIEKQTVRHKIFYAQQRVDFFFQQFSSSASSSACGAVVLNVRRHFPNAVSVFLLLLLFHTNYDFW